MNESLMKMIREKGLLVEKDILDLINGMDEGVASSLLDNLEKITGQKIITRSVLNKNIEFVHNLFGGLPGENRNSIEKVFIKLGISLEIKKEISLVENKENKIDRKTSQDYQIFYAETKPDKKLEVSDFVGHFKARYQQLQRMLMPRAELQGLVSINKIGNDRKNMSIIGIVSEKRVTKKGNLIIQFEDLTGSISALVRSDKKDLYDKVSELQVDDIVGVKVSGSREFLYIQDIIFPDSVLGEKVKFDEDISIAFVSDVHCGSDRHLEKSFGRFLEWINSDNENAKKIKYLFFVGDNVDGVGIFPGQEKVLKIKNMRGQYTLLASYLRRIPKHITMFMCPGQHDATRVAEPQPLINKNYAPELYEIENLTLVTNPTMIKLIEKGKEFKVLMYHGASIHPFINEIQELRDMKAHKCPAKAVKHMLKRRHLAPMHGVSPSIVYIPNADKDPMVISEVPDILCTGEMHRLDIENYNGTIIIVGSCWQAQTPFEEKIGNIPDPCKVPVFNLKTRELKVFDFTDEDEIKDGVMK